MINAHKIKTRMFELQITQDELAKIMSMDTSTLNAKLNNRRRTYLDEVIKLCKILELNSSNDLKNYFGLDFILDDKCKSDPK